MSDKCYLANQTRKAATEGELVRVFDPLFGGHLAGARWFVELNNKILADYEKTVVCFGHDGTRQVNLPLTDDQQERFQISQRIVQASFYAQLGELEDVFVINGTNNKLCAYEIPNNTCIEVLAEDCPVVSTILTDEPITDEMLNLQIETTERELVTA